jgi:hypothetical protein
MRAMIYEIFGLAFLAGSMLIFYQCIVFLAQKDYVAGFAVMAIGFFVMRGGTELAKLAVLLRRERSS